MLGQFEKKREDKVVSGQLYFRKKKEELLLIAAGFCFYKAEK